MKKSIFTMIGLAAMVYSSTAIAAVHDIPLAQMNRRASNVFMTVLKDAFFSELELLVQTVKTSVLYCFR